MNKRRNIQPVALCFLLLSVPAIGGAPSTLEQNLTHRIAGD